MSTASVPIPGVASAETWRAADARAVLVRWSVASDALPSALRSLLAESVAGLDPVVEMCFEVHRGATARLTIAGIEVPYENPSGEQPDADFVAERCTRGPARGVIACDGPSLSVVVRPATANDPAGSYEPGSRTRNRLLYARCDVPRRLGLAGGRYQLVGCELA
ncbi:MAG: hypothetical protein AAFX79_10395 [Planctomycetota bacterium]